MKNFLLLALASLAVAACREIDPDASDSPDYDDWRLTIQINGSVENYIPAASPMIISIRCRRSTTGIKRYCRREEAGRQVQESASESPHADVLTPASGRRIIALEATGSPMFANGGPGVRSMRIAETGTTRRFRCRMRR